MLDSMKSSEWMHVIWALFKEHGYIPERIFRYGYPPE